MTFVFFFLLLYINIQLIINGKLWFGNKTHLIFYIFIQRKILVVYCIFAISHWYFSLSSYRQSPLNRRTGRYPGGQLRTNLWLSKTAPCPLDHPSGRQAIHSWPTNGINSSNIKTLRNTLQHYLESLHLVAQRTRQLVGDVHFWFLMVSHGDWSSTKIRKKMSKASYFQFNSPGNAVMQSTKMLISTGDFIRKVSISFSNTVFF